MVNQAARPGAYRVGDFAGDVIRFLRERVTEPVALLGYSLGGGVAFQVAAEAADLVDALILAEPAPYIFGEERMQKEDPFFEYLRAFRDVLNSNPSLDELVAMEQEGDDALRRTRAKSNSQLDPEVLTHLIEQQFAEHFHPSELSRRIACPVLLLQGNPALGGQVEDRDVERARDLLDHCTHVRLPEAGHNLHRPQPITFYHIVSNFLESL